MCGIVGYVNHKVERTRRQIIETMLEGLARLDYRGYDSTGLVIDQEAIYKYTPDRGVLPFKIVGKVADLRKFIAAQLDVGLNKTFPSHVAIAHTRWAANGKATVSNCHPISSDSTWRFCVVHNGIVTNYKALRCKLAEEGLKFEGETDTEVIAKLAMRLYDAKPDSKLHEIASQMAQEFEGSFSFLLKSRHYPNEIVAVRKGLPLVIGLPSRGECQPESIRITPIVRHSERYLSNGSGNSTLSSVGHSVDIEDGTTERKDESEPSEIFLASDPAAIIKYTQRMAFLEDDEIAHVQNGHLALYKHTTDEQAIPDRKIQIITNLDGRMPSKGDFPHYLRKEIFEQPRVIADVLSKRLHSKSGCHVTLGAMDSHLERLRGCSRLVFVACGSSYYASLAVRNVFEELNNVTVSIEVASEFLDRPTWTSPDSTAFIFVTQSGETAESLLALRRCKDMGCFTVGVVNVVNSSIARQADCVMYLEAGIEIAVATTKAYTSQLVNLVLLSIALGQHRASTLARRDEIITALELLPDQIQAALTLDDAVKKLCMTKLADVKTMLVLGRGYQQATALEAALKIKEISYIHSEAVLSGELKHGVLALIDEDVSVLMIATRDASFARTLNSHEQLISHGGKPIMLCNTSEMAFHAGDGEQLEVAKTVDCLQGVLNVIPLQLMGYWLGVLRGNSVDFPRHVAKSVTVE